MFFLCFSMYLHTYNLYYFILFVTIIDIQHNNSLLLNSVVNVFVNFNMMPTLTGSSLGAVTWTADSQRASVQDDINPWSPGVERSIGFL